MAKKLTQMFPLLLFIGIVPVVKMHNYCTRYPEDNKLECNFEITYENTNFLVNGGMPGTQIVVNHKDQVIINVSNNIEGTDKEEEKNTTIHWHGMHQRCTPDMDGVPYVTQVPIQPGGDFTYHFTAHPAGTHWYHSHVGKQRDQGMFGALIVKDEKSDEKYDGDIVMIVGDFEKKSMYLTDGTYLTDAKKETESNFIINDDTITINKKNKKIRFRAIHAGKHDAVLLKFQEHFLRVIASDGIDFKHHIDVDGIYLTPGERYDFELKTTSVLQKYDIQMEKENEKGLETVGTLSYESKPSINPVAQRSKPKYLNCDEESDKHKCVKFDKNGEKMDEISANLENPFFYNFIGYGKHGFNAVINNKKLVPNSEMFSAKTWSHQEQLDYYFNSYVDMVFFNMNGKDEPHPVHMHGHSFYVMATILNDADKYIECAERNCVAKWKKRPDYYTHPIQKDTIIVPFNGLVVVRIKVNNEGDWFMHCHIDGHANIGMAMVLKEWNEGGKDYDHDCNHRLVFIALHRLCLWEIVK